jgi:hypothetical protein
MRFLFQSLVATAWSLPAAFPRHCHGRSGVAAELGARRALTPQERQPAPPGHDNDRGTALRAARPHWEV